MLFRSLLREPSSFHDFYCKEDSARTPTRAGHRPQLLQQGRLCPDSYRSRAPSTTSTARKTPSGLLREPGFVYDFYSKEDSARTPTGVVLRSQLLQQGRLRPDCYGSRAPSTTSTARKTPPGLLREPGSVHDFYSKEDSARTPTEAGLRPRFLQQGRLHPDRKSNV